MGDTPQDPGDRARPGGPGDVPVADDAGMPAEASATGERSATGEPPATGGAPAPGERPRRRIVADRRHRSALVIAIVAALLAVGIAVGVGTTGGSAARDRTEDGSSDDGASDGDESQHTGTADQAEVVEQGFSTFRDAAGDIVGSYGVVVENTADLPLAGVRAELEMIDPDGEVLVSTTHIIGLLRPGDQAGLGDMVFDEAVADVVDLRAELHDPRIPRRPPQRGDVGAEDVATTTGEHDTRVELTVTSTFDERLDDLVATAVFRHENGAIIGGAMTIVGSVPARGESQAAITTFTPIPAANPEGTTVTVSPG